jgi:predicted ribosome quality control (RQC) complex YloA/Tae2 family protein
MSVSISNLSIKHLIVELEPLLNGFVNKVQTLENGWIKMKIHTKQGGKDLIFTPNAVFISEYLVPAKMKPGGYSALLKKYLFNQRVEAIHQKGLDRIIIFSFPNNYLVVELFAKGNIILTDKDYKIIKAMKKEEWKDRKLEIGELYKAPTSKGFNPLDNVKEDFIKSFLSNKKTAFGACVELLNISPLILEKIFIELGFDKEKNAIDFTKRETEKLFELVKKEYSSEEGKVSVINEVIYSTELGVSSEVSFENINSALNQLLIKQIIPKEETKEIKNEETKQNKLEKQLVEKQKQIKKLELEEIDYKNIGELIYIKYDLINQILVAINKGLDKDLSGQEIKNQINSVQNIIKEIDLKTKKVKIELN